MSDPTRLDDCGCCGDNAAPPPALNPPGLPAISFRAGDYGAFYQRLLAEALRVGEGARPLLSTRASDDPAVALLDAAAVLGDVLTFYNERIANEGFLRTATERFSVLELARAIGYELKPGVAASTYLSFDLAESDPAAPPQPGAPPNPSEVALDVGLQVMSVPGAGEQPQIFETVQAVRARPAWNSLRPRRTVPQTIDVAALQTNTTDPFTISLVGSVLNIKPGDLMLFADNNPAGSTIAVARPVRAVRVDDQRKVTHVDFAATPAAVPAPPRLQIKPLQAFIKADISSAFSVLAKQSVKGSALRSYLQVQGWKIEQVQAFVAAVPQQPPTPPELGVFVLRARTGFFGNNAPRQETLPKPENTRGDAFPNPWDGTSKRSIWTNSQNTNWAAAGENLSGDAYLDRALPELSNGWAVFDDAQAGGERLQPYRVVSASESSLADYGMSGRVTGLNLVNPDGTVATKPGGLRARYASAYLQSEKLTLAELPITQDVQAGEPLEIDRLELLLAEGQAVALSGTRTDLEGVRWSEILFIADVTHADRYTTLDLIDAAGNAGPRYTYQRESVRLNANLALATHGETVREVLGSGNGAASNQRFLLKRPPLTYTSAASASGAASSLRVRVNNALWSELPSLYEAGPSDQVYIVRQDDSGSVALIFGDGVHGARLPSGVNNVTAVYRTGIGALGAVQANTLVTLMTRPLGVRTATNPLDATGAAEPESRDSARRAAPAAVLTLDRVVSLRDFADFARTFAGVGKAQASALRHDERSHIFVTVASTTGDALAGAPTLANLRAALDARRELRAPLRVADYDPRPFKLDAALLRDSRYEFEFVRQLALQALASRFAFASRGLAQTVTAAEVIACLSAVQGVVAVDLNMLDYSVPDAEEQPANPADPPPAQPRTMLLARPARWHEPTRSFRPAQLLYLDPQGVTLSEFSG